jgi:hypothetical protein
VYSNPRLVFLACLFFVGVRGFLLLVFFFFFAVHCCVLCMLARVAQVCVASCGLWLAFAHHIIQYKESCRRGQGSAQLRARSDLLPIWRLSSPDLATCAHSRPKLATSLLPITSIWGLCGAAALPIWRLLRGLLDASRCRWRRHRAASRWEVPPARRLARTACWPCRRAAAAASAAGCARRGPRLRCRAAGGAPQRLKLGGLPSRRNGGGSWQRASAPDAHYATMHGACSDCVRVLLLEQP